MKLSIPASALRSLRDSNEICIRIEVAVDCDGSDCGRALHDNQGELEPLPPHYHMIAFGRHPDAGPRCYGVGGELPEVVYESSHGD